MRGFKNPAPLIFGMFLSPNYEGCLLFRSSNSISAPSIYASLIHRTGPRRESAKESFGIRCRPMAR